MPTTNAAELADRYARALLARETDNSDAINHTIQVTQDALCQAARDGKQVVRDGLVRELARYLTPECPVRAFGILANTAGMVVEWGADPAIALPRVLDRLPEQFGQVPAMVAALEKHFGTANLNNVPPEKWRPIAEKSVEARLAVREFMALQCTGCAAMTMLVRNPTLRIEARKRTALIASADAVRDDNVYAYYVSEVLGMVDGEELLVIDVPRSLGFKVLLTAVRNNFHLFTLLQGELLSHPTAADWTGPRSHPVAVSLARSERMISEIPPAEWQAFVGKSGQGWDAATWTFYQWRAMQPDGTLQLQTQVPKGRLPWWVWGEMKPTDVAAFEGQPVVLLGPLEVTRSWGTNFFLPLHPALRSSAAITEVLDEKAVANWLERFRTARR